MKRIITIVFFGSMWGFLEATIGGLLHIAHMPYTGVLMSSIGFSILYAAWISGSPIGVLAAISIVAASLKWLDALVFGISPLSIMIINPATAIACQGLAMTFVANRAPSYSDNYSILKSFVTATVISTIAFNAISIFGYNQATYQSAHLLKTALIQIPSIILISFLLSKGITFMKNFGLHVNYAIQGISTAVMITIITAIKFYS